MTIRSAMRVAGCAAALAATLPLAACLKPAQIEASDAWVRLPAVPGRPASGYFTLHGDNGSATLIGVTADLAVRTEMHATMPATGAGHAGMMTMRPLAAVPLAAQGEVTFAPGARHLMLFGVSPALKPGATTILTFSFADGRRVTRKALAVGPADAAPE